jgi:hypothetical protein
MDEPLHDFDELLRRPSISDSDWRITATARWGWCDCCSSETS